MIPVKHIDTDDVILWLADCIVVMRSDVLGYPHALGYAEPAIASNSVHSIVTDPPYGIDFMNNAWDRPSAMLGQISPGDGSRGPLAAGPGTNSRGYADHDGRAFQAWCETWAVEAYRVLKPGGMLVAFGGDRAYHRLTSGIEDAGFEIRRGLVWIYGQGFAKGLNVSKAIDKGHASARDRALEFTAWMKSTGITAATINAATGTSMATHYLTSKSQPEIPTSDQFDLLRPFLPEVPDEIEELVRVRSGEDFPDYQAREVDGVHEKAAAGQVWAAPFRGAEPLPPKAKRETASTPEAASWEGWISDIKPGFEPIVVARKPLEGTVASNVLAHGTGAYNVAATSVDTDDIRVQGAQTSLGATNFGGIREGGKVYDGGRVTPNVILSHTPLLDADGEIIGDACADGCVPGCAVRELDKQSGFSKSPSTVTRGDQRGATQGATRGGKSGGFNFGRMTAPGPGDEGGASRFFPAFRYNAKAGPAERPVLYRQACRCDTGATRWAKGTRCPVCGIVAARIAHPTVKPVALIRWLIRLVTVEGGTVLDPFAGSGSGIEAALAEHDKIIAIELGREHLPLIEKRLHERSTTVAGAQLAERLASGVSSPDHVVEAGRLF